MRIGVRWAVVAILALASATCGGAVAPQYEYEEEMYLSLDGSATMWVHSSILALNALRGTAFDERPNARVDTNAVRAYFNSAAARVLRVTSSRRKNRRFVHVRLEIDDVRQLSAAPPFAWSSYELKRSGELVAYKQTVGPPSHEGHASADVTKDADQNVVAFRIHAPSQVVDHNAGAGNHRRGNILVWEQSLSDRLNGVPLTLEALLEPRSILSRTLFLFGATIAVVALMFAIIIWRVVRKGSRMAQRPS
jgi:hypothetical protein